MDEEISSMVSDGSIILVSTDTVRKDIDGRQEDIIYANSIPEDNEGEFSDISEDAIISEPARSFVHLENRNIKFMKGKSTRNTARRANEQEEEKDFLGDELNCLKPEINLNVQTASMLPYTHNDVYK